MHLPTAIDTMRRLISSLLALSLAAAAGCARAPRPHADFPPAPAAVPREQVKLPLRFDGVYRSEDIELDSLGSIVIPLRQFLRFHPDGRVIEVSTPGEMDAEGLGVFTEESGYPVGRATVRGRRLSFSIPDHRGQVDYVGEVRGDRLHLRIRIRADGRRSERVYAFQRIAGSPPSPAPPAGLSRAPGSPALRYDGVYGAEIGVMNPSKAGETAWAYLRFYPEGTVIYTSQGGPPPHTLPYFTITAERIPSGTVALRDRLLWFSVRAPDRRPVDYVGEVRGDSLHLRSHSHINGHRDEKVYVFFPGIPDAGARRTGAP